MKSGLFQFRAIWMVDFEFSIRPGEIPDPVCMVAREHFSGQVIRLWQDELRESDKPPYVIDESALFAAYYSSAEFSCHLALGWALPANVLDLYVEFRNLTNGQPPMNGNSFLGALSHFGLDSIAAIEKEDMRKLALRGGPFTENEKTALLDYCQTDVDALARLLDRMLPQIYMPGAMLRGRYMKAAAMVERCGIPIDTEILSVLRTHWQQLQIELIQSIDREYGIFDGTTFKADRWEIWLHENGKDWPRLETGRLALDEDTFNQEAKRDPSIAPMHELRMVLSQLRLEDLSVGSDGRNRCLLSTFRAKTGRNQPSNKEFIFGPAVWLRSLIRPASGFGLAYIDWAQQEFGIAAALSRDPAMMAGYESGDPYLAFARQAGVIPPDSTKENYGPIREQFKQCVLAVQYGMGAEALATRIGQSVAAARRLLRLHRQTYPQFWCWSDAALDLATFYARIWTVFGWTLHIDSDPNPRSIRNFPMQANGAEMLRLACCLATERGIRVCAPVHDAILIEAPLSELDSAVDRASEAMAEASRIVLGGFQLRSEAKLIRFPDRYEDERGRRMWQLVCEILERLGIGPGGHIDRGSATR